MDRSFTERSTRLLPWVLLLLGLLDRGSAILHYGIQYVSTDDAIIWAAAVDYGQGLFRGPYYYGQNYGPMLEALVAAPFARIGTPLWWLMPIVTTVLFFLPYWSFTFWHMKHGRSATAVCFAALPLLMPVEFNLMTTMSRGFITGLALLAILPWLLDIRKVPLRSISTGAIIGIAWYVNPNSLIFSAGYACWYLLSQSNRPKHALLLLTGLVPGTFAHLASQQWCNAHPDRIVHHLRLEQLTFKPQLMVDGLLNLNDHFQWLMPLLWPFGSMLAIALVAIILFAIKGHKWPLALGVMISVVIILFALGFEKTHEGWNSVFFPLSRMFLALPLLLAWAITFFIGPKQLSNWMIISILLLVIVPIIGKAMITERITHQQVKEQSVWVDVRSVAQLRDDAERIQRVALQHHPGLIVPLTANIWPQFRAYLYPVIEPDLPPTYSMTQERRYWQRESYAHSVIPILLFTGGDRQHWRTIMDADARFRIADETGLDDVHVLYGNTIPTDSIVEWVKGELDMK